MKNFFLPAALVFAGVTLLAQSPAVKTPPSAKLASTIYEWEKIAAVTTPNGVRRAVFDGPTATVDKLHCHITTLNPGQNSGDPRKHLQEEIIIVKEGTVEATVDGRTELASAGSVIFFAANAVTRLRNAGTGPATYYVMYYFTPLTPKE